MLIVVVVGLLTIVGLHAREVKGKRATELDAASTIAAMYGEPHLNVLGCANYAMRRGVDLVRVSILPLFSFSKLNIYNLPKGPKIFNIR